MSWDKGFNFRSTSGYVSPDGTNNTYVLGDAYPTTRNSVTFGWSTGVGAADRNSGFDARLAGINYSTNATFRVDLPSTGTYTVVMAMGDAGSNQPSCKAIFKDNTTSFATVGPHAENQSEWYDATDVNRASTSDWTTFGSVATVSRVFTSTIFNCTIGDGSDNTTLCHLFLSQTGGGPAAPIGRLLRATQAVKRASEW